MGGKSRCRLPLVQPTLTALGSRTKLCQASAWGETVEPSPPRLLKIWWAITWRSVLLTLAVMIVAGIGMLIKLSDDGVAYIEHTLEGNRGLAGRLSRERLREPFTFAPAGTAMSKLESLDSGHVLSPIESDKELASYIQQTSDKLVRSIVFQDPWSNGSELDDLPQRPFGSMTSNGNIHYVFSKQDFTIFCMRVYRIHTVSYLKVLLGSSMEKNDVVAALEGGADELEGVFRSISLIVVNAYDDEGWIGALRR